MSDNAEDLNPKKRGLGRGLDALFGEDMTQESDDVSANEIISDDLKRRTLPIEWIRPCAFQPRKHFDDAALDELAASLALHGILQPLVVRPLADEDNTYEIIAGERRWRAAQRAQLHEIPVVIQYLDDATVLEIALIENLQREDLTTIEEAQAYQKLMSDYGHTQEKLGIALGKSRSHIANILRLLALPESVQQMVNRGELSAGHARTLIGLENAEQLALQMVNGQMSVREAEKLVQTAKSPKKTVSRETQDDDSVNTRALEDQMSNILGMAVRIKAGRKGAGTVQIDYTTLDQLDDVLHRLSNRAK